jgi:hypothetical protein
MHIEFFNQPTNLTRDHVMMIINGEYKPFREMDDKTFRILYLRLLESPQVPDIFRKMKRYNIISPKDQVRQFAMCNLGKLDHVNDLDEDGHINIEFVPCKKRNKGCPFNSELCIRKY